MTALFCDEPAHEASDSACDSGACENEHYYATATTTNDTRRLEWMFRPSQPALPASGTCLSRTEAPHFFIYSVNEQWKRHVQAASEAVRAGDTRHYDVAARMRRTDHQLAKCETDVRVRAATDALQQQQKHKPLARP